MTTRRENIISFLEETRKELNEVLEKIKKLEAYRQRQRQLEDLINRIKVVYDIEGVDQGDSLSSKSFGLGLIDSRTTRINPSRTRDKSIARQVEEIIREKGHSMKVKEIETEFRNRSWSLSESTGLELIRRALRSKLGQVFIKIDRNTWDVKRRAM